MNAWFLIILFNSTTDAKMAMFKSESDCMLALPFVIEQNKNNPDVNSIGCMEGKVLKDKVEKK